MVYETKHSTKYALMTISKFHNIQLKNGRKSVPHLRCTRDNWVKIRVFQLLSEQSRSEITNTKILNFTFVVKFTVSFSRNQF